MIPTVGQVEVGNVIDLNLTEQHNEIDLPGDSLEIAQLLRECLDGIEGSTELGGMQQSFLTAGLTALRRLSAAGDWVQLAFVPAMDRYPEFAAELGNSAQSLLDSGLITNFFFVHKAPGLRIRWQPSQRDPGHVRETLCALAERWQDLRLVTRFEYGVYEPEQHLFGGPRSMPHVHQIFTADSKAWLSFHAGQHADWPAWAHSLRLLRGMLDGLGIVGWEDLDVWDRVRRQTHRGLSPEVLASEHYLDAATKIRQAWAVPLIPPMAVRDQVESAAIELSGLAATWREQYFRTADAYIGPREAAAFVTIFLWNRGRLSALQQSLLTEALADRGRL